MKSKILILDIDGVLITTPPWKADQMDTDGYSKFNHDCVENLNELLTIEDYNIWLSSTRRMVKTLDEFNSIFEHRKIKNQSQDFFLNMKNVIIEKKKLNALSLILR